VQDDVAQWMRQGEESHFLLRLNGGVPHLPSPFSVAGPASTHDTGVEDELGLFLDFEDLPDLPCLPDLHDPLGLQEPQASVDLSLMGLLESTGVSPFKPAPKCGMVDEDDACTQDEEDGKAFQAKRVLGSVNGVVL